jgi:glycosyltransferase involved in cell wall biosynthesis
VHWVNLPTNSGGPAVPRNEALGRARGRYVAYLGHDDLWFPDHLHGLVECIEREGASFAYSLGATVTPSGLGATFTVPENPRRWDNPLSPSNWLHRRDLLQKVGPWSTRIRLGDDGEFLGRVLAAKVRLAYWPRLTALKFAAGAWRMYALGECVPQAKYVEAIRRDAAALRLDLLTQAATSLSQVGSQRNTSQLGLPEPLRTLVRWACDLYGRERWPLNDLLYWVWRRQAGLGRRTASPPSAPRTPGSPG